jgi:ABC-type transporter MlaC component
MLKKWVSLLTVIIMVDGVSTTQAHSLWLTLSLVSKKEGKPLTPLAPEAARNFIDDFGKRAIATLTNPKIGDAEIKTKFGEFLEEGFAIDAIGMFVLGPFRSQVKNNPENAAKIPLYLVLFKKELEGTYANRFREHRGFLFKVNRARATSDGGVIVDSTLIKKPGDPPTLVQWKLYHTPKGPKIYDVIVAGVSLSATKRSEYISILKTGGATGGFDALLNALQKTGNNPKLATVKTLEAKKTQTASSTKQS